MRAGPLSERGPALIGVLSLPSFLSPLPCGCGWGWGKHRAPDFSGGPEPFFFTVPRRWILAFRLTATASARQFFFGAKGRKSAEALDFSARMLYNKGETFIFSED